ncbi:hypothetical protein PRUPE_3G154500 [Prunus persica]|uniref:Uncharacterized protein n=1 Tax=Prunus persica TaxID=3760 RepID=M5WZC8_PRUPE|nr:hypothetical protein PRUPE_3G154500 [Prunus persica]
MVEAKRLTLGGLTAPLLGLLQLPSLFVFGSFSEDKTRSLLQKQSPGKAENPVEKNVLQFGSIYFGTIISSGECNGESSRPQNSVKGLSKVQPLSSLNKQNEVEAVKAANDSLPASLTTPTEKATTDNIDVASLPLSNNEGGLSNQFPSLELQNREQHGRVADLSASKAGLALGELQKENNFLRSLWPVTNPPSSQEHFLHPQLLQKPLHPFLARGYFDDVGV